MNIPIKNSEKRFEKNRLLVTKTDLKGKITYANHDFLQIVQMSENEMIGKPHNVIRHPDMPKVIFKTLWSNLKEEKEVHAYVKNLTADGSYYWVFANVTPSYDNHGKVIGYHSARRFPKEEALKFIKPLYEKLLEAEKNGGITASEKLLHKLLTEKGVSYDEFILSL